MQVVVTIFPILLILLIGMAAAIHAIVTRGQRRRNVPRLYAYPAFVVLHLQLAKPCQRHYRVTRN